MAMEAEPIEASFHTYKGQLLDFLVFRHLEAEMLLRNRVGKVKPSVKVLVIVVGHFIIAISVCSLRPSGFARSMRCLRMLNRCAHQTMLNEKTIWKAHQKTVAARHSGQLPSTAAGTATRTQGLASLSATELFTLARSWVPFLF